MCTIKRLPIYFFSFSLWVHCFGQAFGLPKDSYLQRPTIESLKASPASSNKPEVLNIKQLQAMFISLAVLYRSYPNNSDFIFLARDAEYLYDMAKLIFPKPDQKRLHLLSLSTSLSSHPRAIDLLNQRLNNSNKKRLVFVDTGFSGTVYEKIKFRLSDRYRRSTDLFLMDSHSPFYKGLESISSLVYVDDLEGKAHYTDTAKFIEESKTGNLFESSEKNPEHKKAMALENMSLIKHFIQSNQLELKFLDYLQSKRWNIDFGDANTIALDIIERQESCLLCLKESELALKVNALKFEIESILKSPSSQNSLEINLFEIGKFSEYLELATLESLYLKLLDSSDYKNASAIAKLIIPRAVIDSNIDILNKIYNQALDREDSISIERIISNLSSASLKTQIAFEHKITDLMYRFSEGEYEWSSAMEVIREELLPFLNKVRLRRVHDSYQDFVADEMGPILCSKSAKASD
ncbi:MAG: hypothetical protein VX642_08510 [Bdellovibrionota bacterium]|nr:hypothetical protein [Bdellovibrionota bacterium]